VAVEPDAPHVEELAEAEVTDLGRFDVDDPDIGISRTAGFLAPIHTHDATMRGNPLGVK